MAFWCARLYFAPCRCPASAHGLCLAQGSAPAHLAAVFAHPMDAQRWFDAAYCVSHAGLEDARQLVRYMHIRTGRRVSVDDIRSAYDEIARRAAENGYSRPLDYLKDHFPGGYTESVPVCDKLLDPVLLQSFTKYTSVPGTAERPRTAGASPLPIAAEPPKASAKRAPAAEPPAPPEEDCFQRRKIMRPPKLKKESAGDGCAVDIPADVRSKIIKQKKNTRHYREMTPRERETDNRFDYFLLQSRRDESGKFFYDSRRLLADSPFMGEFFSDLDIDFRKIMAGIHGHNRGLTKDKSRWQEEIATLKAYFEQKLELEPGDDASTKRLASAVAYLMKKLQSKIFETEDSELIRMLFYFKSKLCFFYNFYRK